MIIANKSNKKGMNPEQNQEGGAQPQEGTKESQVETIAIPKSDYEKLNQDLGSLKREIKDLRKSKDEPKEKELPKNDKPNEDHWSEKFERLSFRQAGVTHEDDMELARKTAKKWNMDLDEVLVDDDFKAKLVKQQTARANLEATSGIKGDQGSQVNSKLSPEYWIAKGQYPSKQEVPDRAARTKIREAIVAQAKGTNKKFYND